MTKKDLIRNLMNSELDLNEKVLVSIIYEDNDGGIPILVPIDYVYDQFINVTIPRKD